MKFFKALALVCSLLVATDALTLGERAKGSQASLGKPGSKAATKPGAGAGLKPGTTPGAGAGAGAGTEYDVVKRAAGHNLKPGMYAFYWDKKAAAGFKSPYGPFMDQLIKDSGGVEHRTLVVGTVKNEGGEPEFQGFQCDLVFTSLKSATTEVGINRAASEAECLPFQPQGGMSGLSYKGPVKVADEAKLTSLGNQINTSHNGKYNLQNNNCITFAAALLKEIE
ncbi:hypothetical protein MMC26_001817 [Xylographa opegraphella]|nr:hypothetical protein [Xylographa opegraphella]